MYDEFLYPNYVFKITYQTPSHVKMDNFFYIQI